MYKIKLSPYAKIFYTEWLLNPDDRRYNVSMDQILHGDLNVDRLNDAIRKYIFDHLLLNSHILDVDGEPYWVKNSVVYDIEFSENIIDNSILLDYVSRGFNLYEGPLYRFKLLRISEKEHRFIVVLHHLLVDGASIDIGFFESISNYYNDKDYAAKYSINQQIEQVGVLSNLLNSRLEENRNQYREFWRGKLTNIEEIDLKSLKLEKNSTRKVITKKNNPVEQILFGYSSQEVAELNQIKQKYSVTPFVFGQCIFALLLYRYVGQEKLAISYPIAIKEGTDFIYGAQININLIPYQLNEKTTILELLYQGRDFLKLSREGEIKYCYCPVSEIIQETKGAHILDVCFMQTRFRDKPFEFHGIKKVEDITELNMDSVARDMLLFEQEISFNKLSYRVRYNKAVFDKKLVMNFITGYRKLFIEIMNDLLNENCNKQISNYSILDLEQFRQIVYDFNRTKVEYAYDKTIKELFEEQVKISPDQTAVFFENQKISYRELNQRTNQLAWAMRSRGVNRAGTIVAICMQRGLNLLIGLLATIKAGGTYIPLDPIYPSDRIKYILEEAKVELVLAQTSIVNAIPALKKAVSGVICLDRDWEEVAKFDRSNLLPIHNSNNLMYVIYTSGSTGNPKGVKITHVNVANFLVAMQSLFPLTSKDKFLAATTITFDIAGLEIYLPLIRGAQVAIASQDVVTNPQALIDFVNQAKITYMQATPSLWSLLIDAGWEGRRGLVLLSGGEALSFELAEVLLNKGKALWNLYGPTETTIWSSAARVEIGRTPHIGKPIANTQIYILDANKDPVPLGVAGELYIGGDGVGEGYLARDELTAENFINNPFDYSKITRIYKTNDLARYLVDGNIEYLGRRDFQVKLNGYRVELAEIENTLSSFPGVKKAVVVVNESVETIKKGRGSGKYLVAYYLADKKIDEVKLESHLAQLLPIYMLPSVYMFLNKIPLSSSGKLDRKALPEINFDNSDKYVAPESLQEHLICEEFAHILGLKQIGVNDDFFRLGGNSLKAIALTSALQANFDIKVADIFNLRTPKKISENSYFGKDVLKQKLEQIKLSYKNKPVENNILDIELHKKIENYLAVINDFQINPFLRKPIVNVLLTGATGYLGCNILNELLKLTNYNIFLIVRAQSEKEAQENICRKYEFYFDRVLDGMLNSRVFIIKADIEKENLGLNEEEYHTLSMKIDSIIHSAALVKHYGDLNKFYSANVKATINLLEFAKLSRLKDFHYISTYSILNFGFIPDCDEYAYTEDDMPDNLELWQNVYIQTKLQGEKEASSYRSKGINCNIYRVGNLAYISENFRAQENIEDNAFFSWLKCLFKMQCIAEDINLVEISQVDLTAEAIVKIFDKEQLCNNIFHVFNPFLFNLSDVFAESSIMPIKTLAMEQFIDNIVANLGNDIYHELILKFLLHQGWLDGRGITPTTSIKVLQNRTQHVLKQLDFVWSPITKEAFYKYLELYK